MSEQDTIFISHATPGDNAFAVWLASRLSLAGYKVWCDREKLLGGEDFWQDIESAIRNDTVKFVLVMSNNAFDEKDRLRDGIAKEVALANIIKKQIDDDYFLIPMRIDGIDYSKFAIDFLRLNGIDCSKNWAVGLSQLIDVFERDEVAHDTTKVSETLSAWREIHQHHTRALSQSEELLQSNWLPISELPETLYFYENRGTPWTIEPRSIALQCSIPCFEQGRLLVSYAKLEEMQEALGETVPIRERGSVATQDYLKGRTGTISGIAPHDAKNKVSSLVRQAWDKKMNGMGLHSYEMANGHLAWWFPQNVPEDGQLRFTDFNGKKRRRVPTGIKGKKEGPYNSQVPRYFWHLGFTSRPLLKDESLLMLQPRIVISEDGKKPLENKTRLNSVRRSLTTMWFNDKWRGLLLGFVSWIADGENEIRLPVSANSWITIGAKPLTFLSPQAITADPISDDFSDEIADEIERKEQTQRLSDPAFAITRDEEID